MSSQKDCDVSPKYANVCIMAKKAKNPHALAMVRQRLKKVSPERRSEIAKKAAAARWKDKSK